MKYYNSFTDKMGYIHSIDMVYIEYLSIINPKSIIDIVRDIHFKYPELSYAEHLDRSPHSKYDYYLDGVAIGGVYVSMGKYSNYDKMTKTFDILNMFELRVNPNKYYAEEWFQELLKELCKYVGSGYLRKYDYSIDIPKEINCIKAFDSKKEIGLYKGTYYYGQTGRHGYLKIYDKQKDMKRQKEDIGILTRVEHTLYSKQKLSLETIYILDSDSPDTDYSVLKDTEKAIVEMYLQLKAVGIDYNLKIGRKMKAKLRPYLQGSYKILEYGDILEKLVDNIKRVFKATDSITDENGFYIVPPDEIDELPFE